MFPNSERDTLVHPAAGLRRERIERSPQWRDGKFRNVNERVDGPLFTTLRKFFWGGSPNRKPHEPIATERRVASDFAEPPVSGLRVTWLGHSILLIEIDGVRV